MDKNTGYRTPPYKPWAGRVVAISIAFVGLMTVGEIIARVLTR